MSIAIFIPVRKGSERVFEKNTRSFSTFQNGLLEKKLTDLKTSKLPKFINEIIVSSNDSNCLKIARNFKKQIPILKVIERPEELGNSSTKLEKLIEYVATLSFCDHILWTHVTSPFCLVEDYLAAIEDYLKEDEYDSLMSGSVFKEFLWNSQKKTLINNNTGQNWPRTQDLDENFTINNSVFIANRKCYQAGNRIGKNPKIFKMTGFAGFDVDTEEDFLIAESIYERTGK